MGADEQPATGGGGVEATTAPDAAVSPTAGAVPLVGGSSPQAAVGPLPAAPADEAAARSVAQPATLPFTGAALTAMLLLGLALLTAGTVLAAAGRRSPAHALPGFWSR